MLRKIEFSEHILENTHISNFMQIRPVGAVLFHTDKERYGLRAGRTNIHDEGNCRFSQLR